MLKTLRFSSTVIKMRIIYGVTTYNRLEYLKKHIATWKKTINTKRHDWTLIIADDGSDDGTVEYLKSLSLGPNIKYEPIFNNRRGVHYQVNQILLKSSKIDFDMGFKVEDDIYFLRSGWDTLYCRAMTKSKCEHLLYHDPNWRKKLRGNCAGALRVTRKQENIYVQSRLEDAAIGMGVFWTYTPNVIKKVGYFDCNDFGLCGNGHQDFTLRCCRAGLNRKRLPWDALNSESYIRMVYEDYRGAGSGKERGKAANIGRNGPTKKLKKGKLLQDRSRIYIPYNEVPYDVKGNIIDQ